jgi:radical SAM protein with 4Fe4S-binding SPASM domain
VPRSLYLETTSRCNSLCETCILTFGGREPAKDLGWEEFRTIVGQFPVLERVLLHGIGEPLLNRDLPRMVAVLDAGLDELRVSLDASTRGTYARIRGVDAFDKVIANVERFVAQGRRRAAAPAVSLWFTAMRENIEEISGLVSLAQRTGAGAIHLQRLVYNGLGLATEAQSLHGRLQERETALIQQTEATARTAGIFFSASGATAPEVSLVPTHADQPWSACRRPWNLVYVTVHGNVLPCCIAPWITQHYTGIILGNLFQQSLAEIWWSERYLAFRRDIQTAAPPEPCRGCGVKWSL